MNTTFFEKPIIMGMLFFAVISGGVFWVERGRCPLRLGMTLDQANLAMGTPGEQHVFRSRRPPALPVSWPTNYTAYFRDGRIERVQDNRPTLLDRCRQLLFKPPPMACPPGCAPAPMVY